MKKFFSVFLIIVMLLCLVPVRLQAKDGGSVVYSAILYEIYDVHRFSTPEEEAESGEEFTEGIIIKILGIEVYSNVIFNPYSKS